MSRQKPHTSHRDSADCSGIVISIQYKVLDVQDLHTMSQNINMLLNTLPDFIRMPIRIQDFVD